MYSFGFDGKAMPPCQGACPLYQDIRTYSMFISLGQWDEAVATIRRTNPLPSICGYICPHPCEPQCRRGDIDQTLAIRALKRFALKHGKSIPRRRIAGKKRKLPKVAIIGSGPAGLTAAADLINMRCDVTVFEREDVPGGALSQFIPLYRLPQEVIDQDINFIRKSGVEIKTNQELGTDFTLEDLEKYGYSAILLALGMPQSQDIPLPGATQTDILSALPFLRAARQGKSLIDPGSRVIVVGGGNVGMDAARVAVRMKAQAVRIVCLENREEMPAYPWEIIEAIEEGVEIEHLRLGPNRVLAEGGRMTALECMRCLSVLDDKGEFNPVFDDNDLLVIPADTIILATGQTSELPLLRKMGLALDEKGRAVCTPNTMSTNRSGVFVCGDMVTGPSMAVQAMAGGRQAAAVIARYLAHVKGQSSPVKPRIVGQMIEDARGKVRRQQRKEPFLVSPEQRIGNFRAIELVYDERQALSEASRCLNCGSIEISSTRCNDCLICLRICPYEAIVKNGSTYEILLDRCQACGLCVGGCTERAIKSLAPGQRDIVPRIRAALRELKGESAIILEVFCSYLVSRTTTYSQLFSQLPDNVRAILVPCLGKLEATHLISAFQNGSKEIRLFGCAEEDDCFENIIHRVNLAIEATQEYTQGTELSDRRISYYQVKAEDLSNLLTDLGHGDIFEPQPEK